MRIDKLRDMLQENNLQAMLVTSDVNRRYMTGFTGTAGVSVITLDNAYFITDFRYTEQANEQVKGFEIMEHKGLIQEEVGKLVDSLNIETIGFEKNHLTYGQYESYKKHLKADFIPADNIIEKIRLIKDSQEINIMKKACKIADDAFEHILSYIKPGIKEIDVANELEFFMRKQGATS